MRVGRQQSNRFVAELIADTLLVQGLQLIFCMPLAHKKFIVILELLAVHGHLFLVVIYFAVGWNGKFAIGTYVIFEVWYTKLHM